MDSSTTSLLINIFFSCAFLSFFGVVVHFYYLLWLKPQRLRKVLQRQGVGGPRPSLLGGNLPELKRIQRTMAATMAEKGCIPLLDSYLPLLFPYIDQWKKEYGNIFMYTSGHRVHLSVTHPDLVKDISMRKSLDFGKPSYLTNELAPIMGKTGILRANGQEWADQRKVLVPEFFMDKVKGMMSLMVESTQSMLKIWENRIDMCQGGVAEMQVDGDLRGLSADVISKACFGSSYEQGKEMFNMLATLKRILSRRNFIFGIPNFRYLPSKVNREIWRMERNIDSMILNMIKERKANPIATSSRSKDLLTIILENANANFLKPSAAKNFIIDNCKNFYLAGHDTSAITAMWALVLLSSHPEWQIRARAEVLQVCKGQLPTSDSLTKMKMVTMVIQETLRLFPPGVFVSRATLEAMEIGNIHVPKDVNVWVPIPVLHRDPNVWGLDVNEFRPDRFEDGISGACKVPHAYMPFGAGHRICLGQNFAMIELKIILSLILSNFTFSLSPRYRHCPKIGLLVEPGNGVDLLVERI